MSAARFVARTQHRHHWDSLVVLTVLAAFTGTAVLTLATAWRRADTVIDRWSRTAIPYDRFVVAQLGPEEMRALPGVERADRQMFVPLNASGGFAVDGQAMDLSGLDSTTILLDGTIPSGDDPSEVLIDEVAAAQLDLGVGDTVDVQFYAPEQGDAIIQGDYPRPDGLTATVRVTGVIRPSDAITADRFVTPADGSQAPHPIFVFPISLLDRHADGIWRFGLAWAYSVQFEPSADPAAFESAAKAAIGPGVADYLPSFQMSPPLFPPKLAQIEAPVHTQARVLLALALIVALASALALVGATRATERQFERDRTALHALGTTRGSAIATALWRSLPAAVVGLALAVLASWLLSDRLPIGLASRVEPTPGRTLDLPVVTAVIVTWSAVFAACVVSAVTERTTAGRGRRRRRSLPQLGLRHLDLALASGRSSSPRGQRSALIGGIVAVAALVTAGTVVAGLDDVVASRASRGMWGDLLVGNSNFPLGDDTRAAVADLPGVRSASTIAIAPDLDMEGHLVTLFVLEPSSTARMRRVLRGRMPEGAREVMLGAQAAEALHKDLGDIVTIAGQNPPADFTVVGIGPAPVIGDSPLGESAVISSTAISDEWGGPPPALLAVELDDPALAAAVTEQLSASTSDIIIDIVPGTVQNLFDLRWLLLWAATVVVVVAALLATSASVAGHRRWRRDAAILRAFGATPRDLLGIAGWTGLLRGALVGVAGTALGTTIGVRVWDATADALGLPAPARVPALVALAVAVPVALFVVLAVLGAVRSMPSHLRSSLRTE